MIVVCGEALMDVFDAGATPTGQALDARIGGTIYNVALELARLQQRWRCSARRPRASRRVGLDPLARKLAS